MYRSLPQTWRTKNFHFGNKQVEQAPEPATRNCDTAKLKRVICVCCHFDHDENVKETRCASSYWLNIHIPIYTQHIRILPKIHILRMVEIYWSIYQLRHTWESPQNISCPVWSWSIEVTAPSNVVLFIILPVLKLKTWETKTTKLHLRWECREYFMIQA